MKSNKVFCQRLNQELRYAYPTREIEAKLHCKSYIRINLIQRSKWLIFNRKYKIRLGEVDLYVHYSTTLNIKRPKFKRIIDDLVFEYFGDQMVWLDEDSYYDAHIRATKNITQKIKKPIPLAEDPDFNIKGAL